MAAVRVRKTFAGVEFTGFEHKTSNGSVITVPVNAIRKILKSGKVRCVRNYRHTDDYKADSDENFGKGQVAPDVLLGDLISLGKPWLCSLDEDRVRFCPMQSLSYSVYEKQDNGGTTDSGRSSA